MLDLLKIRRKAKRRAAGSAEPSDVAERAAAAAAAPAAAPAAGAPALVISPAAPPEAPPEPDSKPVGSSMRAAAHRADAIPAARAEPQPSIPEFDPGERYESPPVAESQPSRRSTGSGALSLPDVEAALRGEPAPVEAPAETPAERDENEQLRAERELGLRHLICLVGDQQFAVPIVDILEILRVRPLTRVPLTPGALAGILSLRGRMIPVVDGALRLGLQRFADDENTRIIVFDIDGEWVGLRVAGVGQVTPIDPETLQHTSTALGEGTSDLIMGVTRVGDKFVTVPVLARMLEIQA